MIVQLFGQLRRKQVYLGLGLALVVLCVGVAAYNQSGQIWYLWLSFVLGMLILLAIGWYAWRTVLHSVQELATANQTLAEDCQTLSNALDELARGNLTTRVDLQSQPLAVPSSPTAVAVPLVEVFNSNVANIHSAAEHFNAITDDSLQRVCYVGSDYYLDGRICGEAMGMALGGQGTVIVTVGYSGFAPLDLRRKGFESVLGEKYPAIQVVEVVETTFDPDEAHCNLQTILKCYPDLAGVYVTDGAAPSGVARAVADTGKAGRIKIICHDLADETVRYLACGAITATLWQDLFAQGHDSVVHLFNHLVADWRPPQPRLLTHLQLITRDNYRQYWQPEQGLLAREQDTERLATPIRSARCPLRIAMQNREMCEVDHQLRAGAMVAAATLRAYNARIDFFPGGTHRVRPIIESAMAQDYDAMIVLAVDNRDVFHVNRAVHAGIPVATYNAEPFSLRGLFTSLTERAEILMGVNQSLTQLTPNVASVPYIGYQDISAEPTQQEEVVRRAIEFMQDNLENSISVADVAQAVFLNSSYFGKLFTEQTGRNPKDFLAELRIERAKQYLSQTDTSVMDVCVALGYNPSYFSRFFKHHVGCTPGEYALRHRCR